MSEETKKNGEGENGKAEGGAPAEAKDDRLAETLAKFGNLVDKAKEWARKNQAWAFLGGLAALVLLAAIWGAEHKAPARYASQAAPKPAVQTAQTQAGQAQTTQARQAASQAGQSQDKPAPLVLERNGARISVVWHGPAQVAERQARTVDGRDVRALTVSPDPERTRNRSGDDVAAALYLVVPAGYQALEFTLSQVLPQAGEITWHAYQTLVEVLKDGQAAARLVVTKDAMLVSPKPVRIPLDGKAAQVAIKLATDGRHVKDRYGYDQLQDKEGPWFPLALEDLRLKPKEGGENVVRDAGAVGG